MDRSDQRKAFNPVDERVFDDLAEKAGESEKSLGRQVLTAKEDHQVVEPGPPKRRDRALVEVVGKIDSGDLGPERAGDWSDLKRTVGHRSRLF
jgi:hypothetical protein